MGIEHPENLCDDDYKKAYADYLYLRKLEYDFLLRILKQAIIEVLGKTENTE